MFWMIIWLSTGSTVSAFLADDDASHRSLHPSGRFFTPQQLQQALANGKAPLAAKPNGSKPGLSGQAAEFLKQNPELAKSLLEMAAEMARENPQWMDSPTDRLKDDIAEQFRNRADLQEMAKKLLATQGARDLLDKANRVARGEKPTPPKKLDTESDKPLPDQDEPPLKLPKRIQDFFPPQPQKSKAEGKQGNEVDNDLEKSAEKTGERPNSQPNPTEQYQPGGERKRDASKANGTTNSGVQGPGKNNSPSDPKEQPNDPKEAAGNESGFNQRPEGAEKGNKRFSKAGPRPQGTEFDRDANLPPKSGGMQPRQPGQLDPAKRNQPSEEQRNPLLGGDEASRSNEKQGAKSESALQSIPPGSSPGLSKNTEPTEQGGTDGSSPGTAPAGDGLAELLGNLIRENPDIMKSLAESARAGRSGASTIGNASDDRSESGSNNRSESGSNNRSESGSNNRSESGSKSGVANDGSRENTPSAGGSTDDLRKMIAELTKNSGEERSKSSESSKSSKSAEQELSDALKDFSKMGFGGPDRQSLADAANKMAGRNTDFAERAKELLGTDSKDPRNERSRRSQRDRPLLAKPNSESDSNGRPTAKQQTTTSESGGLLGGLAKGAASIGGWAAERTSELSKMSSGRDDDNRFNPPPFSELRTPGLPDASMLGAVFLAMATLVALGFFYWWYQRMQTISASAAGAKGMRLAPLTLTGLSPREQAVRLFEHAALSRLGENARPKHHRLLAVELKQERPADAQTLADVYESARYTPPQDDFNPVAVEQIKNILKD